MYTMSMRDLFENVKGVGIDIVDVSRFSSLGEDEKKSFLKKVFFESEIAYCTSYKNEDVHLAGMFALKEAVSKALGVERFPFAEIEVRHDIHGAPLVWHKGSKLNLKVSISHTDTIAIAIAVV